MQKILIVEDDTNINNLLQEALSKAGYSCEQAFSGTEAKLLLNMQEHSYALVLLDLMLPGITGEAVLEEIRKKGNLPVIVLTAKDSLDEKVKVLTSGADDYITKPFEIREVLARIKVQLRHTEEKEIKESNLSFREMVLNKATFQVSIGGKILPKITRQEFAILELLLRNPKQVFSKEDIFEYAWDEPYMGETKTLWKYQRQVKDICRQLTFMMKHDSNMLINHEFDVGGIGKLSDKLNELLELRRKEKQHYQEKEALIADTYTNLSHDIRTPLTSLDGYFQLMEECENIEDQKRYLIIIHERIHSLNEMLEELFMFTKLKNESYSLELTLCCMNRILKETVFSYYDEWVRMEIQPDIQITEEQLYIHGNRQGLRRVIQNVIKNGLDHGEKKISIVLERDQNQAVLRISNQVTHPEQINIDQVFERFYKADVARSKTSTGLGLSIAKELVSRMDGEIEAKIEKKEFIVEMNFPIVTDAK